MRTQQYAFYETYTLAIIFPRAFFSLNFSLDLLITTVCGFDRTVFYISYEFYSNVIDKVFY